MSLPALRPAVIALVALALPALADVPEDMGFQGRLLDASGSPVAGPVDMTFGIWTDATDGELAYEETHVGVEISDGVFHVLLGRGIDVFGETSFPDVFAGALDLYLEITVNGETLSPRQPIASAAYAFRSGTSNELEDLRRDFCQLVAALGREPPPTCTPFKRVFVTSARFTGDLGGIAGADQKCLDAATNAGLGGTFRAWISDGVDSPSTTFQRSTQPYQLLNGTRIADDWDDLVDGELLASIDVTETADPATGPDTVWTGTFTDGTPTFLTCTGFSQDGDGNGSVGRRGSTDQNWTSAGGQPCTGEGTFPAGNPLYCFEQ